MSVALSVVWTGITLYMYAFQVRFARALRLELLAGTHTSSDPLYQAEMLLSCEQSNIMAVIIANMVSEALWAYIVRLQFALNVGAPSSSGGSRKRRKVE